MAQGVASADLSVLAFSPYPFAMPICEECSKDMLACVCQIRSRSRERGERDRKDGMATVPCGACKLSILKDCKFCSECGAENNTSAGKRTKTPELSLEAQSIVAAINTNTDKKIDSLKKEIRTDMDLLKVAMGETKVRVDEHEKRMKALEVVVQELTAVIEELKTTSGVQRMSKSSDSSSNAEWHPQFVYIRGFSPFGAPQASKLAKAEYIIEATKFLSILPAKVKAHVTMEPPRDHSHQMTFRCLGGLRDCEVVRNYFYNHIENESVTIKGKPVKAVIESSPQKRAMYKSFFNALDIIKLKLGADQVEISLATMTITTASGENIGNIPRDSTVFEWNKEVCTTLGLEA